MSYTLYIIFGILPSFVWLLFYLRKDVHPESNKTILMVFLSGMLIAPLVAFLECIPIGFDYMGRLNCFFSSFCSKVFSHPLDSLLYFVLIVGLIEEIAKYLVVKFRILKHRELDEPTDLMLYMIIAALGFAAVENILILFQQGNNFILVNTLSASFFRFLGATFLHTLCSGTIGFFVAMSFCETKSRKWLFSLGIGMAVLLHGLYNFYIMEGKGGLNFLIPLIIICGLAVFVSLGFKKLRKLASVCKIS